MNKKIIDYIIIKKYYENEFAQEVKKWIAREWQPLGGVSVTVIVGDYLDKYSYSQAMVKYED